MSALSAAVSLAISVAMLVIAPAVSAQSSIQPASSTVKRDPLDVKVPAPLAYRSAFSDYQPLSDDKVGWKEANDSVGRIGGWRVYAREANEPDTPSRPTSPAPKPAAPDGSKPMPSGHSGHSKK